MALPIDGADVLTRLQLIVEQLNVSPSQDLSDLADANAVAGYHMVLTTLSGHGYSAADLNSWIAGETYNMEQALYLCLRDLLGTAGGDEDLIERYNHLEELEDKNVILLDDTGAPIAPTGNSGTFLIDIESVDDALGVY